MPNPQRSFDSESEGESGFVHGISGPVVMAADMRGSAMYELVKVGHEQLLGEVIRLESDTAIVQVFEETHGLAVGDPVVRMGHPLSAELAPGLLGSIFDGIQRPLKTIQQHCHSIFIPRGITMPPISREKQWEFHARKLRRETNLTGGDILGYVYETKLVKHHIMVPPNKMGKVKIRRMTQLIER